MPVTVTIEDSRKLVEIVDTPYIIEIRPGFVTVTNTEVDKIYTAGGTVSVGFPVYLDGSGQVQAADADTIGTRNILGVAITSATIGNPCTVRTFGEFTHVSYSLTTGTPAFVGSGGGIVDSPNGTAYVSVVGIASAADTVYINPSQSIDLV